MITFDSSYDDDDYPAHALRALGLLLADSVPIVGLVETFWRETGRAGQKQAETKPSIWTGPTPRATNAPLTKNPVVYILLYYYDDDEADDDGRQKQHWCS